MGKSKLNICIIKHEIIKSNIYKSLTKMKVFCKLYAKSDFHKNH
jgi:hypothetical protein